MLTTLFESDAKRKRSTGGLALSLGIHAVLIGAGLAAGSHVAASTLEKPKAENIEFVAPPKPLPEPEKKIYVAPKPKPPEPVAKRAPAPRMQAPRVQAPAPRQQAAPTPAPLAVRVPANVPVLNPPTSVPTSLPAIDRSALETTSDIVARASDVAAAASRSASGTGSGGSNAGRVSAQAGGDVAVSRGDGSAWGEEQVDKAVQPLGKPNLSYPDALRSAGLSGTVSVRFVVGPNGRVEMGTIKVIESPHDRFTDAVKSALRNMRYRPAEVRGTKVRQLVEQQFTFKLDR